MSSIPDIQVLEVEAWEIFRLKYQFPLRSKRDLRIITSHSLSNLHLLQLGAKFNLVLNTTELLIPRKDELPADMQDTLRRATVRALFTPAHWLATSVFLEEEQSAWS